MTDHLSEQDKALCAWLDDEVKWRNEQPPSMKLNPANAERFAQISARIRELSAQLAEHPNATDWQNRAERAEQFAGELQAKIDALQQHAEALAEALGDALPALAEGCSGEDGTVVCLQCQKAESILANWTAWLLDGGKA